MGHTDSSRPPDQSSPSLLYISSSRQFLSPQPTTGLQPSRTAHPRLTEIEQTVLRGRTFVTLDPTASDDPLKQLASKQHPCHVTDRPTNLLHRNLLQLLQLLHLLHLLLIDHLLLLHDSIFLLNITFTAPAAWLALKLCQFKFFLNVVLVLLLPRLVLVLLLLDLLLLLLVHLEQGVQRGDGQGRQCLDASESIAAADSYTA